MTIILNLIVYNPQFEYNEMKNIIIKYLEIRKIKYFFYYYDNNITEEYIIENNILKIKGQETFLPGILEKTIKAFEIVTKDLNIHYDYLLRTNISTIVDIEKLENYLNLNNVEYAGGHTWELNWLDPKSGIIDNRYFGLNFISGTAIIISYDNIKLLINNKNELNRELIDDVSIGLFFQKNNIKLTNIGNFTFEFSNDESIIFYRNRRNSRMSDICYMKLIIYKIINSNSYKNLKITEIKKTNGILYGKNNKYFDITDIFNECFKIYVNENLHIIIPKDIKFNDFFGDPCPGYVKEILISFEDKFLIIDENRNDDIKFIILKNQKFKTGFPLIGTN